MATKAFKEGDAEYGMLVELPSELLWPPSFCMSAEDFGHLIVAEDFVLKDGTIIKAGTRLRDIFPDGVTVHFEDGMTLKAT
jgi:hypothetical protein